MALCSIPGCDRQHYARGYCNGHYQRARSGTPMDEPLRRPQGGPCAVDGCDRPSRARGLCSPHYRRQLAFGDVRADDPIGRFWRDGHARSRRIAGRTKQRNSDGYVEMWHPDHPNAHATGFVLEHRYVMAEHLGRALYPDETVHHKNTDRADNRIENLELRVGNHGRGGSVNEVLAWARTIVERYG